MTAATQSALPDLPPFERAAHRAVCAQFSSEVGDVALSLVDMIPRDRSRKEFYTRLTKAAYRKGFVAGLSSVPDGDAGPDNPYTQRQLSNFMRGDNDPGDAWQCGVFDGQRIRHIVLCDGRAVIPGLQGREYLVLTAAMREVHDARIENLKALAGT